MLDSWLSDDTWQRICKAMDDWAEAKEKEHAEIQQRFRNLTRTPNYPSDWPPEAKWQHKPYPHERKP